VKRFKVVYIVAACLICSALLLASLSPVYAIRWDDFRRTIANLTVGRLTVTEDLDVESGVTVDINGTLQVDGTLDTNASATMSYLSIGGGTELTKLWFATEDIDTSVTAITVTGVLPGDYVLATSNEADAATFSSAVPTTNTVTLTLSADPSAARTWSFLIAR
jgi:hypothetical protein